MNQQVGRYRVLGRLGKGAMGVVYLAEDPVLNRRVAIKTVELAVDDRRSHDFLRDRLVRDGRAAAGLSHPNIVSVYDVLEEGECGYLVMEYIAGETLSALLARTPRPDTAFVARVLREMASALDYTHVRGIIHRDIKPANVMLDAGSGGAAKIMDFGIARIADTRTNTPAGTVMGTLEYMAPEQIKGEPVDGRADQFSLAAVAYEMLTGSTLFGEQHFATLAYKLVNEMPPPLRTHSPGLPAGVEEVVARALRKPPAERFQTCGGFVAALERAFAGEIPATGALTQAMFIPSMLAGAAPPVAPVPAGAVPPGAPPVGRMSAATVPPAFAAPPAPGTGPASFPPTFPAATSQGPTSAVSPPAAPLPVAPGRSNRGLPIGIAGVVAALVLGGALLLWKPWAAPPAAQPEPPVAGIPNLPASPVTKSSHPGSGTGNLPSQPPAAQPAPDVQPVSPQPPQAPPPQNQGSQAQAPQPPASRAQRPPNSAAVEPSKPAQVGPPEPANDTPPGSAIPPESDGEGKVAQPARAAYREGEEMVKADRYPAAIQAFSKAIELNPAFVRAYLARGAAYLHLNRSADAFSDYTEILRRNPRNAVALAQRGICHARLHDEDAAMADYNRALEMRPDLPGALNGRGLVYTHRKQYQKAIQDFTNAIQVSPDYGWAYANRAHAEEAVGNQKAAQADLKKAKDLGLKIP